MYRIAACGIATACCVPRTEKWREVTRACSQSPFGLTLMDMSDSPVFFAFVCFVGFLSTGAGVSVQEGREAGSCARSANRPSCQCADM